MYTKKQAFVLSFCLLVGSGWSHLNPCAAAENPTNLNTTSLSTRAKLQTTPPKIEAVNKAPSTFEMHDGNFETIYWWNGQDKNSCETCAMDEGTSYPEGTPHNSCPQKQAESEFKSQLSFLGCTGSDTPESPYVYPGLPKYVESSCLWQYIEPGKYENYHCTKDIASAAVIKKTTWQEVFNDCIDIQCNFIWSDFSYQALFVGRLKPMVMPNNGAVIP